MRSTTIPIIPFAPPAGKNWPNTGTTWKSSGSGREARYGERLSPGTKIADLIGDLDPAKVAAGNPLASEEAIHFGLIPRMNRGIFAVNELPDLEYLVQVALFNILEERDIQVRGYPIRFDLDLLLLFTANPEEYTRAGKIITQLKDRIGAEIRTHYPLTRELGIKIIQQEAHGEVDQIGHIASACFVAGSDHPRKAVSPPWRAARSVLVKATISGAEELPPNVG